jgi:LysM repeat protein
LHRRTDQPAPLRLTGRGRLVLRGLVVALMLVVMATSGLALARGAHAADGPAPAVVVHTHVVLPGETLWAVAQQVAPHDDPRDTVARIVEFNSLTTTAVQAGQRLALPPGLPTR